jgi:hypothetical protein
VTVPCTPERAFQLFTEEMGTWWPADSYSGAVSEFARESLEVTFTARNGGTLVSSSTEGGRGCPRASGTSSTTSTFGEAGSSHCALSRVTD